MKILQEITEWEDNTPNHVYHVNDAGKLVAYQRAGTNDVFTFKNPISFDKRKRKFITIKEIAEKQPGKQIKGSNGNVYFVHDGKCTCSGFKFRGSCKHINM